MAASFEDVRKKSYEDLGDVQETLRSDWIHDANGPTYEQVQALDEARRHLAAAKAALTKAAGTQPAFPQTAWPVARPARRFTVGRR
jgi:hypothetical protein